MLNYIHRFSLPMTTILLSALLAASQAVMAESDMQQQEKVLKAREMNQHQGMDHSAHENSEAETQGFRGVFYGYLPCKDCDGVKMSLSLKQNNKYLLVTQYAKESSREYYEKGQYSWDDKARSVVLTPNKNAAIRRFSIEDEGTLIQLSNDGKPLAGDQEQYALRRSDTVKSRQVHIH